MGQWGTAEVALLVAAILGTAGCVGLPWAQPTFEDVSRSAGLTYEVDGTLSPSVFPMDRLGGGVAVGDVNQDGWPDVYVADAGPNVLYLNQHDGTFEDATEAWHASEDGVGRAPALFDMDNDGDLDLFVANYVGPSRLFENTGDRYEDVTPESGINLEAQAVNVAVADVDGNGYLDLFVGSYGQPEGPGQESWTASENGGRNRLYLNNGDGTFDESGRELGMNTTRWTLASAFTDLGRDGDPDLYVANDFGVDTLFVNQDGRFVEQASQRGIEINTNGMGATWFDADGDADLDLYVTAIYVPDSPVPALSGNDLLLQEGDRFRDVTEEAGVADGAWSWHAEALDVENDGDEDLYVADGFHSEGPWDVFYDAGMQLGREVPDDAIMSGDYNETHKYYFRAVPGNGVQPPENPQSSVTVTQGGHQRNRLFLSQEGPRFTEAADEYGVDLIGDSRAAASLDHDRDGDLDLLVTAAGEPIHLLENRVADVRENHWLQVTLDPGPDRPSHAFGALVELQTREDVKVRQIQGPAGFLTQSEPIAQFGLGEVDEVEEVVVHWPWGETTSVDDVEVDQRVAIDPSGRSAGS